MLRVKPKIKSVVRTRVTTTICPNCKDEFYSRAHHDFHYCSCGDTAVDGGFDYVKVLFKNPITYRTRYVNATKPELYDDWNTRADKYGFITKSGGL